MWILASEKCLFKYLNCEGLNAHMYEIRMLEWLVKMGWLVLFKDSSRFF